VPEDPPAAKRATPGRAAARSAGDVDLVHGPLHLMILKILTWGPLHGYAIARSIRGLTGDVLAIEEGSLYPALHRMEDRGWVEAEWGLSDGNRRARFYRLTEYGRAHLGAASPRWLRFAEAVASVLAARERPAL
jgi:transcriptional regulator